MAKETRERSAKKQGERPPFTVRSPHNVDVKTGWLVRDAEFFPTRSGRPKVVFRLAVPRDVGKPQKPEGNVDFIQVVAYGDRFVELLPHLRRGVKVTVMGWTQSRDVVVDGVHRVVVETVAETISFAPGDARSEWREFAAPEPLPWEVEE